MNEIEKQIRRTFHTATGGMDPSEKVKERVFSRHHQGLHSSFLLIRLPVAVSFFTTIMAVPISVY